jgi:hypothetical protein
LIVEAEEKQIKIPHVFFGDVHEVAVPAVASNVDDSDEDNDAEVETDPAVVDMLGFDPAVEDA